MEDFLIETLDDTMRKKLKERVHIYLKEEKKRENIDVLKQKLQSLSLKLDENKRKRNIYLEKNKLRQISESEFERVMYLYEYEGYALELEMLLIKKELFLHDSFLKRLQYISLLLEFPKGKEETSLIHKKINKKQLYLSFSDYLLQEKKKDLELEQKILQLYLLYNSGIHYEVSPMDHFYLKKDEKDVKTEELLLVRERICMLKKYDTTKATKDIDTNSINDSLHQDFKLLTRKSFK